MTATRRLTAVDGALLLIDLQEKVLATLRYRELVIANAARLARAAAILAVPTLGTEQYPKGLGPTVPGVAELLPTWPEKATFHACGAPGILDRLADGAIRHVTLAGIEAHVCVAQTALELLDRGYVVQVPADAVGSRSSMDWEIALRRLERAGAVVTTTEAVLFEWTESSAHPRFKEISALVKGFVPPGKVKDKEKDKDKDKDREKLEAKLRAARLDDENA